MTLEEFKSSIYNVEKPSHWREGQFVFNTIDSLYGVARAVQFQDGIDCFYNDSEIYSNFKNWYIKESRGDSSLELDKDCLSYLHNIPKVYSKNTCILIPHELNTFISTIGKGIYLTKSSTYCVRLRRKLEKINKNFKTYTEAVEFKKKMDVKYLELLLNNYDLPVTTKDIIRKYVKVFKYPSNLQ